MKMIDGRLNGRTASHVPEGERTLHERIVAEAAEAFGNGPWQVVTNGSDRKIFGIAPGIYPALVALDGTETSVAWVMEVVMPSMMGDEASWDRWARTAAAGVPTILAVPPKAGRDAEKVAALLGINIGLVYEYGLTLDGVTFQLPRQPAARPRAS